jgi:hypothetical protein
MSAFFDKHVTGNSDLVLEQLEERIVLDGAVDWEDSADPSGVWHGNDQDDLDYYWYSPDGNADGVDDYYFRFDSTTGQWERDSDTLVSVDWNDDTWVAFGDPDADSAFVYDGRWHDMGDGYEYAYNLDGAGYGYWWYMNNGTEYYCAYGYDAGDWWWDSNGYYVGGGWEMFIYFGGSDDFIYDGNQHDMGDGSLYTFFGSYGQWELTPDNQFACEYGQNQWWWYDGSQWYAFGGVEPRSDPIFDSTWHSMRIGIQYQYTGDMHVWYATATGGFAYDIDTGTWLVDANDDPVDPSWVTFDTQVATAEFLFDGEWHQVTDNHWLWLQNTQYAYWWSDFGQADTYYYYDMTADQWWRDVDGYYGSGDVWETFGDAGASGQFIYDGAWYETDTDKWFMLDDDIYGYWWYETGTDIYYFCYDYSLNEWWQDADGDMGTPNDWVLYGDPGAGSTPPFELPNDAPLNTVPVGQTTDEDTALVFSSATGNSVTVSDPDAGAYDLQVTLSVTNGALTLSTTEGLMFISGANSESDMTFEGSANDINAALEGMVFLADPDFNGTAVFTITANDLGNVGTGGAGTDTDAFNITVTAVNDAPVNIIPGAQTTSAANETLVFSTVNGNAIQVSDVDINGGDMRVTLLVNHGILTLDGVTGLTFLGGSDGSDFMHFTGTVSAVNDALDGMIFTPDTDYTGWAGVVLAVNDLGQTGVHPQGLNEGLGDIDKVDINVGNVDPGTLPANQAPTNSIPGPQVTSEDTAVTFVAGTDTEISVSDPDAGNDMMAVKLRAFYGTITLSQTTNLFLIDGDGTDDAMVFFMGTAADINAALDGLIFTPDAEYSGTEAGLQVITFDAGNSGIGAQGGIPFPDYTGIGLDVDWIGVTVEAVNDAPINTIPGAQTTSSANETLVFSTANGNQILVSDSDIGDGDMRVTLTSNNGSLDLNGTTGLTFLGGSDGSGFMQFTGTITAVNNALDGLVFTPDTDYTGWANVTITSYDLGNTGQHPSGYDEGLGDMDKVDINVGNVDPGTLPVNQAPTNTVPTSVVIMEDSVATFISGTGTEISVSDPQAGETMIMVQLRAFYGTVTLSQTTNLGLADGDGTNDEMIKIAGTVTDINAALNGLIFTPDDDYYGNEAGIQVIALDFGSYGTGAQGGIPLSEYTGIGVDVDWVPITVEAVNDAPINTFPGMQTTSAPNETLEFSIANGNEIQISDVDIEDGDIRISLLSNNGIMTLSGVTGLTFLHGTTNGSDLISFTGTLDAVNAALDGLVFTPDTNYTGWASVAIGVNDLGNTGVHPGGLNDGMTDFDKVDINVGNVDPGTLPDNQAPTGTVPSPLVIDEDTPVTFYAGTSTEISVSDPDAGNDLMLLKLTAFYGTLTLSQTTNLIMIDGDGTDDDMMRIVGTISDINAALDGMVFTPDANYNGAEAGVQVVIADCGNNGIGASGGYSIPEMTGIGMDVDWIPITVVAVNDFPVGIIPADQVTNAANDTLVFSTANGNPIQASDVDLEGGDIRVTLISNNGIMNLSGLFGLTFLDGTADGSDFIQFTGSLTDVNAALDGLLFTPDTDYTGWANVTIGLNDLGQTGVHPWGFNEGCEDIDKVDINVGNVDPGTLPVNDAPSNTVPQVPTMIWQGTPFTFLAGTNTELSISDPDVGDSPMAVKIRAYHGTLTLPDTSNLILLDCDGTDDTMLFLVGTLSDINDALDGLIFTLDAGYDGYDAAVQILTLDGGAGGMDNQGGIDYPRFTDVGLDVDWVYFTINTVV